MRRRTNSARGITDGRRKRRDSSDPARRKWYATHRMRRFARHFGGGIELERIAA